MLMMMASISIFLQAAAPIAVPVVLILVLLAVSRVKTSQAVQNPHLQKLATIGIRQNSNGPLTLTAGIFRSLFSTSKWVQYGYRRYSKAPAGQKSTAFGIPSMWTGSVMVVLPPSLLSTVLSRPETELRAHRAQLDTIQFPYMMSDAEVYDNPIQFGLVRRHLSSQQAVHLLAAPTATELHAAFMAYWPNRGVPHDTATSDKSSGAWTTLNVWDACGKVLTRAVMLSLVGRPLCHDERLLHWVRLYASSVITGTGFINCLPPGFLRSTLGPLFGIRARQHQNRCLQVMVPVIEEAIARLDYKQASTTTSTTSKSMRDDDNFLQSTISRCARTGDPAQLDPQRIALRLLGLATMSIMGMVWVLAHCIADVYGTRPRHKRDELIAALEAECIRQQAACRQQTSGEEEDGDSSSRGATSSPSRYSCPLLDSTIYESMRLNNLSVTSLARDVVVENLLLDIHVPATSTTTNTHHNRPGSADKKSASAESDMLSLPRGTRIVFPTQDMHRDERIFGPNPEEFDPFRFYYHSSQKSQHAKQVPVGVTGGECDSDSGVKDKLSKSLLVFGYGRHACPGKHYAMQTLKQALSYIILNYDVELVGPTNGNGVEPKKRKKPSLGNVNVPDVNLQIRVSRKREGSS